MTTPKHATSTKQTETQRNETMKITITAFIAAATLTACTASPEMIQAQKDRCTDVGYHPGTLEHAQCAERGTQQQQAMQNAAVGTIGGIAAGGIVGGLIYR